MLTMLTKELLYDMGIKAVGDVLTIFGHADAKKPREVSGPGPEEVGKILFKFFCIC